MEAPVWHGTRPYQAKGSLGEKAIMNERIQRALDGELPPEKLSSQEAAELAEMEVLIDGALWAARRNPAPDLAPAVLARIRDLPEGMGAIPAQRAKVAGWRGLTA